MLTNGSLRWEVLFVFKHAEAVLIPRYTATVTSANFISIEKANLPGILLDKLYCLSDYFENVPES